MSARTLTDADVAAVAAALAEHLRPLLVERRPANLGDSRGSAREDEEWRDPERETELLDQNENEEGIDSASIAEARSVLASMQQKPRRRKSRLRSRSSSRRGSGR